MHKKEFDAWGRVKKRIEKESRRIYIRAGEIKSPSAPRGKPTGYDRGAFVRLYAFILAASGRGILANRIRWISMGVNIGSEIDGKGVSFTRPALIIHCIGSYLALVVPMPTKIKDVVGYLPFQWKGKSTSLCIHQIRIISQKRVLSRLGRIL